MNLVTLTEQDLATILAALRFYQEEEMAEPANRSDALQDIATNGDKVASMTSEEIDYLCQRLNYQFASGVEFSIQGPEGFFLWPEPYRSLDELITAAAKFPLRFLDKGYYLDARRQQIPIAELPEMLRVIVHEAEPDDDEDSA